MEQTARQSESKRTPFTVWHALGLLLLLAVAVGVWFGFHPYYRFVSAGVLAVAVLAAWKRNWMWWIVAALLLGIVAFLWMFGPAGYRYASAVPFLAAVLIVLFRFCKRPVRIAASVAVGLLAALLAAVEIPIVGAALSGPQPGAGYVIVLGAAVYGEAPSVSLRKRLDKAVSYLEENPSAKVVVSGGQGEGEDITEAECMRRYLIEKGIDKERILTEDHSTSTMENLAYSKAVIEADGGDASQTVIVSSAYHLYRAKAMAASLGMDAWGAASSDGYPIYMFGMYLREALAVTKLWLFGAWERSACLASVYASVL